MNSAGEKARELQSNILKHKRGLHHRDLARFVLATWKLLRRVVQTNHLGTRSVAEWREKERGRKKGGKRRERKREGRERREGTCTRARRTRLSGQFESIKPKVAVGLCSSRLARYCQREPPFRSPPSTNPAILSGSRGNKPAIFTLHRQPPS